MEADPRLDEARRLTSRIRALALRNDFPALLEIDAEPETGVLLDLLSNDLAAGAEVHLETARRWRQRREAANRRRLAEAQTAIDGFDLPKARALLGRLEIEYLTAEDAETRDATLLAVEARAIESEELNSAAEQAIAELRPHRWWRRRGKR